MGLIAKKFVTQSLMLALSLSLGYLGLPESPAAQNYPHVVVLEQKVKEATGVLLQRQREAARAQEQVKSRQRLAGELAILLVKAEAQHAMIEQWNRARSSEPKMKAREGVHKKLL